MTSAPFDIVVIGLGPAGASAALTAAKTGARVIGLERKREAGVPVQCAEFVPALIGMEVENLAQSLIQDITEMVTFVEDEAPDLTPNFSGKMIDRAGFDAALIAQARQAGAEVRLGVHVAGFDDAGGIMLPDGEVIRAHTIIGADGPHSLVGEKIGSINEHIVETRQITTALCQDHQATDIFLSRDIPGGYGWLFPKGARANLGLGVWRSERARLKPALEALHADMVRQGRLGADILGWTGGAIPVGGLIDARGDIAGIPVLLAGDAAGLTNPVTGAGIASAVASGKLAGEAMLATLAGDKDARTDYKEELDDVFGPALRRAVRHRLRLLQSADTEGGITPQNMRRAWIAYPEYWAA